MSEKEARILAFMRVIHHHFGSVLGKALTEAINTAPPPPEDITERDWKASYAAGSMTGLLDLAQQNAAFHGMSRERFAKALQNHGELVLGEKDGLFTDKDPGSNDLN